MKDEQKREKEMLTVEEASAEFHVARTTIRNAIYNGKLPAMKRGSILFIDKAEIELWRQNAKPGRPVGSTKKQEYKIGRNTALRNEHGRRT